MADDKIHNSIGEALKNLAATISPFVMLAFTLIAYIYTQGQSDNQSKLVEMSEKMDRLEKVVSDMKLIQTQNSSRIERNAERSNENKDALKELTSRQNDLDKTVIFYNANRR